MSITATSTMETTIMRSEDGAHRYLLSKEWDAKKPQAMLIMLCAGTANAVDVDMTTMLVVKNLHQLDFGGVSICNLFSTSGKETDEENDRIILNAAMNSETIIFGWGTGSATNPMTQRRISEVLELLRPYQKQTYCIAAPNGKSGLHPLAPALRERWRLVPWITPHEAAPQEKAKTTSMKTEKKTVSLTGGVQSSAVNSKVDSTQ